MSDEVRRADGTPIPVLEDGATETVEGVTYRYDKATADDAVKVFHEYLTHVEGEWAGEPFMLEPWQEHEVVRPLFGWKRPDGTRRYRFCFVFIPRKNGKSTLAGGIGIILLMADKEAGAQVYSAAADTQQANIIFRMARQMTEANPALSQRLHYTTRNMAFPANNAFWRVLSADAFTKHGLNAHGVLFDELHAQPNRDLWDVLVTSQGSRRQPLVFVTTTAGVYDQTSICWEQYSYAKKVASGEIVDPEYLAVIYEADPEDDYRDPATWAKANPNFGVSVKREFLERQSKYASEVPSAQNTFRRLHLNQWTMQSTRWVDMETWDANGGPVDEAALRGQVCFAGLDLASTQDINALVLVFPRKDEPWPVLCRFYMPEDNVEKRGRNDGVPYATWARQGHVTLTPGNVTDYEFIRHDLHELAERYDLKGIAIDRWNATQLAVQLGDDGLPVVLMGQGFASMAAPSKEFERRLVEGGFAHGGHPVLRWMAGNVAVKQDAAGNIKPDKSKSSERIDGIVAQIMAVDQATRMEAKKRSIYEDEDLFGL